LNFKAEIEFNGNNKNRAIFDSLNIDRKFYPENPTETEMVLEKSIIIKFESQNIAHLRANLNSTLRLLQASFDSINSVKIFDQC